MVPAPVRLGKVHVEGSLKWLVQNAPIPWDRQHRPAAQLRSDQARAAHEQLNPVAASDASGVDDVEARIAARKAKLEADRQKRIAERKAAMQAAGSLPQQ